MKSVIFTCISLACMLAQQVFSHPQKSVAHRDDNQKAVLDISIAQIQPSLIKSMTECHFTNIRVVSLDISDNVFNPFYYASMGIGVTFQEPGSNDIYKLTYLYPVVFDPLTNQYHIGTVDPEVIKNAVRDGNPDNNFCAARNCVGCNTMRDQNGRTMGCTVCIPINDDKPYSCVVENSSGIGGGRIINALGGLIRGIIGLF